MLDSFRDCKKSIVDQQEIASLGALTFPNSNASDLRYALPQYKGIVNPAVAARFYLNSPVVNTCVNMIADYCASVPIRLLYQPKMGSPEREVQTGYPYNMLKYINCWQTQADFIRTLVSFYLLNDNAYICIEKSPAEFAKYSEFSLYIMNPQYTKVVPDPETHVDCFLYQVAGKRIYIPAENVIHIKGFSPIDSWYGLSNMNTLVQDTTSEQYAKRSTAAYFETAATISGILTVPANDSINDDEIIKLKRDFAAQAQSGINAYRIIVLKEGMKFEVPQSAELDAQLIDVLENNKENIAMVLGVPPSLISADTRGVDFGEVEALFWNRTLKPLLTAIAQTLTKKLAWVVNTNLRIEFDLRNVTALMLEDLNRGRVNVAYQQSGIISPNQILKSLGLEPWGGEFQEWGDSPTPVYNLKYQIKASEGATGASPSMPLAGSEGGRDQSSTGEAQMIDSTGSKSRNRSTYLNEYDPSKGSLFMNLATFLEEKMIRAE